MRKFTTALLDLAASLVTAAVLGGVTMLLVSFVAPLSVATLAGWIVWGAVMLS